MAAEQTTIIDINTGQRRGGAAGVDKFSRSLAKIQAQADRLAPAAEKALDRVVGLMQALSRWTGTLLWDPIGLADSGTAAQIRLEPLLAPAGEARGLAEELARFAGETPFDSSQVLSGAQTMLAAGWQPADLLRDLRTVGDAAAAAGQDGAGFARLAEALARIQGEGKLTAGALDQLAATGVLARNRLEEALGTGWEQGGMESRQAIRLLLQEMQLYEGTLQKLSSQTAGGLWAKVKNTLSLSLVQKWGQGLQSGAKRGMGSIASLLNKSEASLNAFGEQLKEIGSYLSNKFADGLEQTIQRILKVTDSDRFKNASAGEKISILWDEVIAQPFGQWWDTTGKTWAAGAAEKMGQAFAGGLAAAIKGMFQASHFGGGDSWVADALALGGMGKLAGLFAPLLSGGFTAGRWLAGAGAAADGMIQAGGNGLFAHLLGSTGTVLFRGSGALGALSGIGYGMGSAATTGAGLAAAGGAGLTGGLLGGAGLLSAIYDLVNAEKERTEKDKRNRQAAGAAKLSLVGAGAGLGAILGSFVPVIGTAIGGAIGAGLGGIGALLGGGAIGRLWSDSADGTTAIRKSTEALREAANAAELFAEKRYATDKLLEKYNELGRQMSYTSQTQETVNQLQEEQRQIVAELAQLYPELISQYDIENGKLGEKAGLIQRLSDAEKKMLELQLDKTLNEGELQLSAMKHGYEENKADYDKVAATAEKYSAAEPQLDLISSKIYTLRAEWAQTYGDEAQKIKSEIDEKTAEFNEIMQGVDAKAGTFNYNEIANKSWRNEWEEVMSTTLDLAAKDQELKSQFATLAEAKMQSLELKLGAPLDELAAKYDTLDEKQKEAFDTAIRSLHEYVQKLDYVPEALAAKVRAMYEVAYPRLEFGAALEELPQAALEGAVSFLEEYLQKLGHIPKVLTTTVRMVYERAYPSSLAAEGPGGHATGGIFGRGHIAWFAEAGRKEAVIPLEGANRERGKSIWAAAGEYLGFKPVTVPVDGADGQRPVTVYKPQKTSNDNSSTMMATAPISVNMGGVNFTFGGGVSNSSEVMAAIREQMPSISNELAAEIARQLRRVFHNSVAEGV